MDSYQRAALRLAGTVLLFALGTTSSMMGQLEAAEPPQLDPDEEIVCAEKADGTLVRMQCDEEARRCLVAKTRILRDGRTTSLIAQDLSPCVLGEAGVYERLERAGYAMVPALLETREGYRRDELGRVFQTSFDLRRRFHLGVHDMVRFDAPPGQETGSSRSLEQSLVLDVGSVHDAYNPYGRRRHRYRFLEGQLMLNPFEIDAQLYSYDRSRASEEPAFWITTFIGTPRRFDIPIQLGAGYSLARLHYRRTEVGDLMLLDLVDGRINWELYQGADIENYLLVSMGAGMGLRHMENRGDPMLYIYPELGLKGAWVLGNRGLAQVEIDGRMKWGYEPNTAERWAMGTLGLSMERIIIAISDQPISIFLKPHMRYSEVEFADLRGLDYRLLLGARLSLFSPPRPSAKEL